MPMQPLVNHHGGSEVDRPPMDSEQDETLVSAASSTTAGISPGPSSRARARRTSMMPMHPGDPIFDSTAPRGSPASGIGVVASRRKSATANQIAAMAAKSLEKAKLSATANPMIDTGINLRPGVNYLIPMQLVVLNPMLAFQPDGSGSSNSVLEAAAPSQCYCSVSLVRNSTKPYCWRAGMYR